MIFVLAAVLATAVSVTAAPPDLRPTPTAATSVILAATYEPPAPPVSAKPTVAMRALAMYQRVRKNEIDRTLLTPTFSAELTPEVAATLANALRPLGEPGAFVERARNDVGGVTTYDYAVAFGSGAIALTIGIDDATGAIAKFYVRRAAGVPGR